MPTLSKLKNASVVKNGTLLEAQERKEEREMVLTTFNGAGIGFGFGIGCGFGVGWGFGGMPLHTFGLGVGGGCGVGLGLGWGFGNAFGCKYRSSKVRFQGIEFDKKPAPDKGGPTVSSNQA